ncbi:unnamed protein product [Clonostachys rosea f. rosea IK726]|uniref:Uncharacterized protein n=1 Tax=Clonostachys rosea f. rosea IK726 TaxID=1349383 RepID=A0ACA9T7W0_BIOOC|nr:unnamed protein product [Clonostachys rosea f. rosea IK726]
MIRPLWSRPLATAYRASCNQSTRWFCVARPRLSEKLLYPENRTASQHRDLPTFLAYAKRTGLDEKSTVFVGTHYEYTIAGTLSRYGFSLQRVGGASDCGVDLLGTWTPPKTRRVMKTLVQCKAGAQRAGPNLMRELEGAEGVLKQMIWNHRAEEEGLEGFGVATRHVDGQEGEEELVLLRNGVVLPLLDRTG